MYANRTFWVFIALSVFLGACSTEPRFSHLDPNFYWSTDVVTESNPSANNHVLLLVDDSGSMYQKVVGLKAGLPTLVTRLNNASVKYYVHMLKYSQINFADMEAGRVTLTPAQTSFGAGRINNELNSFAVADFSKEYGIALLSAWMRKLFPQYQDLAINNFSTALTPVQHISTLTSDQKTALTPFFVNVNANPLVPNYSSIFAGTTNESLNNLQTILSNYDYYVYSYLRDQVMNQRSLNYIYPVFLSDEDDEGAGVVLSGTADSFTYDYERTFTQMSNLTTNSVCKLKTAPADINLAGYKEHLIWQAAGPKPYASFMCTDNQNGWTFALPWNVAGDQSWGVCKHPGKYSCKSIMSDGNPGPDQVHPNVTEGSLWWFWDYIRESYMTSSTDGCFYGSFSAANRAVWQDGTPKASYIKYDEVCRPVAGEPADRLAFLPNDCINPLWRIPGVQECSPVDSCALSVFPAVEAKIQGNAVVVTDPGSCDLATETYHQGAGVAWVQAQLAPNQRGASGDYVPFGWGGNQFPTIPALPANIRVSHWVVKAKGKFVSNTWLNPADAKAAIEAYLATKTPIAYPGIWTGFIEGEEAVGITAIESFTHQPQVVEVTKAPPQPDSTDRALFSNAPDFKDWVAAKFPDVEMHASAIVKLNSQPCAEQVGTVERGQTYMDLADATGGLKMDICDLGVNFDFTPFMNNLAAQVIRNNLQSIAMQGPKVDGKFEVIDVTANNVLTEGVHFDMKPGGLYGFVQLRRDAVPAGHRVRVSVHK